ESIVTESRSPRDPEGSEGLGSPGTGVFGEQEKRWPREVLDNQQSTSHFATLEAEEFRIGELTDLKGNGGCKE
ncbi:Fatty Acid Synthase, partial [Manis pentadactyla]